MSHYKVYVTPSALREIKELPGPMRQRVKRAINEVADAPRLAGSKELNLPDISASVWRLRIDRWRIVYAITETDRIMDILAVRKRPPYDYGDLDKLLAQL